MPESKTFSLNSIACTFLGLTLFSLPFYYRPATFLLIVSCFLLLLNALISRQRPVFANLKYYFPWLAYYLIYAVSYFYSSDKQLAFADLETKFSLFILPLVPGIFMQVSYNRLLNFLRAFVSGMIVFSIIALGIAVFAKVSGTATDIMQYHSLVNFSDLNAAYISWYVLTSIIMLLFCDSLFTHPYRWIFTTLLIVMLLLLAGRSMQLIFFLIVIPVKLYQLLKHEPRVTWKLTLPVLWIGLLIIAGLNLNKINSRYQEFNPQQLELPFLAGYDHFDYQFNNLSNRLFFWRVAWDNLSSGYWLSGTGAGDVNQVQNQRMHDLGIKKMFDEKDPSSFRNTNVHNMYLQSWLAAGIAGLISFLLIMLLPFLFRRSGKDWIRMVWMMFHFAAAMFMMHESAFQTQAGVIFFSLISVVFMNYNLHRLHQLR